jgi:hypothetical protein
VPVTDVSPFHEGVQLPFDGMMKASVQNLFPVLFASVTRFVSSHVAT